MCANLTLGVLGYSMLSFLGFMNKPCPPTANSTPGSRFYSTVKTDEVQDNKVKPGHRGILKKKYP